MSNVKTFGWDIYPCFVDFVLVAVSQKGPLVELQH